MLIISLYDSMAKNCDRTIFLHVTQTVYVDASSAVCENFLHFFIEKVISSRALISPPSNDPSVSVLCSAVFDKFELVTLSVLHEIVGHLKPSGSPYDAVPPRFVKEVFPTVGPSVLAVVNSSLSSGVVPENFKHAVVQPSGFQTCSWGPTALHILHVSLIYTPDSDHQLISKELHELK